MRGSKISGQAAGGSRFEATRPPQGSSFRGAHAAGPAAVSGSVVPSDSHAGRSRRTERPASRVGIFMSMIYLDRLWSPAERHVIDRFGPIRVSQICIGCVPSARAVSVSPSADDRRRFIMGPATPGHAGQLHVLARTTPRRSCPRFFDQADGVPIACAAGRLSPRSAFLRMEDLRPLGGRSITLLAFSCCHTGGGSTRRSAPEPAILESLAEPLKMNWRHRICGESQSPPSSFPLCSYAWLRFCDLLIGTSG